MRRIALVNPNTNTATTKTMVDIARACAPRWMEIVGVTAETGDPLIASPSALNVAASAVLALAPKLATFDVVIVSAFGDPGRVALANALTPCPVIGIGESSMAVAHEMSNGRFAVAQTIPGLNASIGQLAETCGYGASLVRVLAPDVEDAAELMADARATEDALAELIHRAVDSDGARAVIIGGGPLAVAARSLAPRFACPIIEPIPATIARAASMIAPHVLFSHGLESGPHGYKVREMRAQGLAVTAPDMHMSLFNVLQKNSLVRSLLSPSALLSRWPSQWLAGAFDDSFAACVSVHREALREPGCRLRRPRRLVVGRRRRGGAARRRLVEGPCSAHVPRSQLEGAQGRWQPRCGPLCRVDHRQAGGDAAGAQGALASRPWHVRRDGTPRRFACALPCNGHKIGGR